MPRPAPQIQALPPAFSVERLLRGTGAQEAAFWLDSATEAGRFSLCGIVEQEEVRTGQEPLPAAWGQPLEASASAAPCPGRPPSAAGLPPLVTGLHGGWVGYLGHEARRHFGHAVRHTASTPESCWMPARRYVVLDRRDGQAWAVGEPAWIHRVLETCSAPAAAGPAPDRAHGPAPAALVLPVPDRTAYQQQVDEALEHIREGNSYEVCLTAETTALWEQPLELGTALDLYAAQRATNPAPHAAFLWCQDFAVLSSSPERFLRVDPEGWCQAHPIKGTMARSADPAQDAAAAQWLRQDPKSRAENLMIVDLMRNDFSRVCTPGTVGVPSLMAVESYANVHQLVSTVAGRLAPGRTAQDLVAACFPGGSMTGAPKPRTLEIIEALEQRPRGIYAGALGWMGADGAADLSIVIRTLVLEAEEGRTRVRVAAGGAVVADSDPEAEYQEMLAKMQAPLPPPWHLEAPAPPPPSQQPSARPSPSHPAGTGGPRP